MGKRTRSTLAYIATRLDVAIIELQRLNARLDALERERTPAPDDSPFTYISTDTGYYDFASDPKWQTHYLKAQPDGTFQTRERPPADADAPESEADGRPQAFIPGGLRRAYQAPDYQESEAEINKRGYAPGPNPYD